MADRTTDEISSHYSNSTDSSDSSTTSSSSDSDHSHKHRSKSRGRDKKCKKRRATSQNRLRNRTRPDLRECIEKSKETEEKIYDHTRSQSMTRDYNYQPSNQEYPRENSNYDHQPPYSYCNSGNNNFNQNFNNEMNGNWNGGNGGNSLRDQMQKDKKRNQIEFAKLKINWHQFQLNKNNFSQHVSKVQTDMQKKLDYVKQEEKRLQDTSAHCKWLESRLKDREAKLLQECIKYEKHVSNLHEMTRKNEEQEERLKKRHSALVHDEIRLQQEKEELLEFVKKCSANSACPDVSVLGLTATIFNSRRPLSPVQFDKETFLVEKTVPGTVTVATNDDDVNVTVKNKTLTESELSPSINDAPRPLTISTNLGEVPTEQNGGDTAVAVSATGVPNMTILDKISAKLAALDRSREARLAGVSKRRDCTLTILSSETQSVVPSVPSQTNEAQNVETSPDVMVKRYKPSTSQMTLPSGLEQLRIIEAALRKINPEQNDPNISDTESRPSRQDLKMSDNEMSETDRRREAELEEKNYWKAQRKLHEERLYTDKMWEISNDEDTESQKEEKNSYTNVDEAHQWQAYLRFKNRQNGNGQRNQNYYQNYGHRQGQGQGQRRYFIHTTTPNYDPETGMTFRQLRRQAYAKAFHARNRGESNGGWVNFRQHEGDGVMRDRHREYSSDRGSDWY